MATQFSPEAPLKWAQAGSLPYAEGHHPVGLAEVNIRHPDGSIACPAAVLYPSSSSCLSGQQLPWLSIELATSLGRSQLAELLTAPVGMALMATLGPSATGFLRLPAIVGAPAAQPPAGGWPTAVFAHCLTGWGLHQSALALSLASHGVVVVIPTHADGTACSAHTHRVGGDLRVSLAAYESWPERRKTFLRQHPGASDEEIAHHGSVWRRSQNDVRLAELNASLDGLHAALAAAQPNTFGAYAVAGSFARVGSSVTVLGMSFGGATAAAFALRDATKRVAHAILLDPWLDQDHPSPLDPADLRRSLSPALRTMLIYLNGASMVRAGSEGPAATLVAGAQSAKARLAKVVLVEHAGHYAQTDIPCIFEHGPLRCLYLAIKGKSQNVAAAPPAREALTSCIEQMLGALAADRWIDPLKRADGGDGPA